MKPRGAAVCDGRELIAGAYLHSSEDRCVVLFDSPMQALSTAVLNGGYCLASAYVNVQVDREERTALEEPALTISRRVEDLCGDTGTVGMMTAASMASMRVEAGRLEAHNIVVVVTSGLDNARRAGDRAEYRTLAAAPRELGTINTAVITDLPLTAAAQAEVLVVATEAKVAVLQELGVSSPVSGEPATGTGTDSCAVFCRDGKPGERYAGKHTLLGERLARIYMRALRSSLESFYGGAA